MSNNIESGLKIGLSLSGGGFRASVFHVGVLKGLAERELLSNIKAVSTVSGGSFTIALIFMLNNNEWPNDQEFLNDVLPRIKKYFTEIKLGRNAVARLFSPLNWSNLFSRANIISKSLKSDWGLTGCLSELPEHPEWYINATTIETGKNWRFSKKEMGDWKFGYVKNPKYNISDAVAASAAFPGYIGRFSFQADDYKEWCDIDWESKTLKKKNTPIDFDLLHLSDGGVYNNLGEEAFIETLGEKLIDDINYVVVSDATQQLKIEGSKSTLRPIKRALRLVDITMEQIKLLRVRSIHNLFDRGDKLGLYIQLGQYSNELENQFDLVRIKNKKTTLFSMSSNEYDELVDYGRKVTSLGIEKWYLNNT